MSKKFPCKPCKKCGKNFFPSNGTQVYCGSKTNKTGCSWAMVGERDKIRGKLPHRKKANLQAQKRWKKEQRINNTDYAKRQRSLKKKYNASERGRELAAKSAKRNSRTKLACNRRRNMRKKSVIGWHTEKLWENRKKEFAYKCAHCGVSEHELAIRYGDDNKWSKLTRDHIFPISFGGTDYITNIQPLCINCNAKKNNDFADKIVCVSGGMDCVHAGHINLLEEASHYGKVVVILNTDEWLIRKKGKFLMDWKERATIIGALQFVYGVYKPNDDDGTVCDALRKIKPDYFANGGDRTSRNTPELDVCNELGIIPLFNIGGEKTQSSSDLLKNYVLEA